MSCPTHSACCLVVNASIVDQSWKLTENDRAAEDHSSVSDCNQARRQSTCNELEETATVSQVMLVAQSETT